MSLNAILGFAINVLSSIGGGFMAILFYVDYKGEWVPFWPFGFGALVPWMAAFSIFLIQNELGKQPQEEPSK